jgi:hypothetical protein
MKIQVVVFWVVTPCSHSVGYQHFGGLCCLSLQGEVVHILLHPKLEVFTAMKIQVVFCVVTPCSDSVGYQHFGGLCCFHL